MTRIEELHSQFDASGLTRDQERSASSILLGYIAGAVPEDVWDQGIALALKSVQDS